MSDIINKHSCDIRCEFNQHNECIIIIIIMRDLYRLKLSIWDASSLAVMITTIITVIRKSKIDPLLK
jgi:hypothetical protein